MKPCDRVVLTLSLLALFSSAGVATAQQPHAREIVKVRALFDLIRTGEYDAFLSACDAKVQGALPAPKLKEVWEGLTKAQGPYERELSASAKPVGEHLAVDLICKFKSGPLKARISIDKDGKVAGLFFLPANELVEYAAPDYVDSSRFREEEVSVTSGEFQLPGTLTVPVGDGPFPAVALVHGSGPHDRDETVFGRKPFKDIAGGLATLGVAVLRYEKRTYKYGASMDPEAITIDSEVADDAIAAVRLLIGNDAIRSDRVFLVGHSLGAGAAPYIATKESGIAGVIMLAAPARPVYELVDDQIPYLAAIDGTVDDAEQANIDETRAAVDKLRKGTWKPGDMLLGAPAKYWASLDKMAPVKYALKYEKPMLIIHGGRDYQVSMKDFAIWKKELGGRKNVTLKKFSQLDHLLTAGKGKSTPAQYQTPGHVDRRLIERTAKWIHARG
ncbi:MAG: alpha/beta fold hydrolase [Planctomycetota bacterium]|nr:alpha/beta fold hydrolase [Planctomycetota bacterium]